MQRFESRRILFEQPRDLRGLDELGKRQEQRSSFWLVQAPQWVDLEKVVEGLASMPRELAPTNKSR
jgi:hypothetical protein